MENTITQKESSERSMQNISKLVKKCESFSVVSFDIFDTLLKRDVQHPTDVFRFVEQKFDSLYTDRKSEFCMKRCKAEKKAREESRHAEITLDEIYEVIDYSEQDKMILKRIELEMEASLLHRNAAITFLFHKCINAKKKVYIVSDMYLPQDFLEAVLKREGISGYKKMLLSCVYRKTKKSGEIFKILCEETKISPERIIHIGDSRYADYIGPRKVGIKSIYIKRQMSNTLYTKIPSYNASLSEKSLYSFINTRVDSFQNRSIRLGYEVLGPIIYAYCRWLHDTLSEKQEKRKIWFAARDMFLFRDAYRRIYGNEDDEDYIYLSRNSLRPVYAQAVNDITKSGNVFARGKYSIRQIIEYLGYSLEETILDGNLDLDLKKYDIRKLNTYPEVVKALSSSNIQKKEKILAELGNKYLLEHGLFSHDIILADVGWHGTIQFILQEIKDQKSISKKIYGMYLGCLDGTREKIGNENYSAFIFDEDDESRLKNGILLFECLILAPHGSTKGYEIRGNRIEPIIGNNEVVSTFIKDVQHGAKRFIADFTESSLHDLIKIDSRNATKAFEKMTCKPHKEEIEAIGNLEYDNFYCNKMASPKKLSYYIFHIGELRNDFKYSPWRIGFLYKLFRVRLPYAKMYTFVRRKQGKMT